MSSLPSVLAVVSPSSKSEEWGPLLPIDPVPQPKPLPIQLVPKPFRGFVQDIVDRMCVPAEFIVVPLTIGFAAVAGRKFVVKPEEMNPWMETPNLWGANVADPGMLKSPAQRAALAPLRRLQSARYRAFEAQSQELKERQHIARLRIEALETSYKHATKTNAPTVDLEADMQAQRAILDERAIERRYYVNEATVEKLGEILRDNPQGVLQVRDELTGFLRSMDRSGREGDRAFYLEGWNGQDSFTVDRIGRGTIHIPALCVLNFGGIQPGPLREIVAEAVRGGSGADGLVQRFSLMTICLKPPPFKKCERQEDAAAEARVDAVFAALDQVEFDGNGEPHVVRFDDEAQAVFDEWRTVLENRALSDSETPAFRAWLTKQRKTVPALALLFHLISRADSGEPLGNPIGQASVVAACAWSEVLETHARHIYAGAVATPAMTLAHRIERGDLKDNTSVRELKRRKWSSLTVSGDVDSALDELAASGWLNVTTDDNTGGRPTTIIRLHPDLRREHHA